MLTFVDHGRQFEDDSLTNWEPMQISKNGSDMILYFNRLSIRAIHI